MVARIRMTNMSQMAYSAAVKAAFERCNRDCSCNLAEKLRGITVDWQINGIKDALVEEHAEELLRGCRVSRKSLHS